MLENVRIVMIRPRGSGNIGSVARAMKNFGARDLAVVGKARTDSFWARGMAVHGRDVLAQTKRYESIREA
ncbi:MAG TPA: TrmH family RNA methyltransferase, partial [Candidatus Binatia bacterium]|nr:TrmH family RNA methyltransferase [Candidatus Binatia bacterium]